MTISTLSKDEISKLTLAQSDDYLKTRGEELAAIFAEAKSADGTMDLSKVSGPGAQFKTTAEAHDAILQYDKEMNDVGSHLTGLVQLKNAADAHDERSKARRTFSLPGVSGKGNHGSEQERFKSLGEMIVEGKAFKDWIEGGKAGSVNLHFGNALPTDLLSFGVAFDTIGAKALMSTTAGFAPEALRLPGFVEAVTRPIQMLDIIPMSQTSKDSVSYMEETTRTHAAAGTAEGGTYAESTFAQTEKTSPVRKITDSLPVTDEQLEDEPFVAGYINGRLIFGIRQKFDRDVLLGDGAGSNLRGLKNVAGIQTQAKGTDPVPDAFYKAMTKIRVQGRSIPTHHVMHPTDWQTLRLMRTAEGMYLWGNPSEAGPERLWGLPVIQNDADVAGTGYTGSFQPINVSGFERKGVDVQVGFTGTQFTEGKRTVRADMRAALVWFRPVAFCSVTGL